MEYEGNETLEAIVQDARKIMIDTFKSVFEDRGVQPPEGAEETPSLYSDRLQQLPAFEQVDYCLPETLPETGIDPTSPFNVFGPYWCNGKLVPATNLLPGDCNWFPKQCQEEPLPGQTVAFAPYQNCSFQGTYQSPECAQRLPCCEGAKEVSYYCGLPS